MKYGTLVAVLVLTSCGIRRDSLSNADKNAIITTVLNHPTLEHYLHPEANGRIPVVLSDKLIGTGVSIEKFNMPVQIVPDDQLRTRAFLRFIKFDVGSKGGTVALEYPIEGVLGRMTLRVKDGKWFLENVVFMEK